MAPATKLDTILESPSESTETPITREHIAALAYFLWQERGCPEGSPEVDWLEAEAELSAK
jgi:Protein of unknown function (DUF2934)